MKILAGCLVSHVDRPEWVGLVTHLDPKPLFGDSARLAKVLWGDATSPVDEISWNLRRLNC